MIECILQHEPIYREYFLRKKEYLLETLREHKFDIKEAFMNCKDLLEFDSVFITKVY